MNSSWSYKFIKGNDLNFYIKNVWPSYFKQYCEFKTIQKAAIQRIAAVHKYGGVYADCDVYPIKKADSFIDLNPESVFFILKEHSNYKGQLVADYIFASEKESKLLNELVIEIFKRSKEMTIENLNGWSGFIYETCSIHAFSEVAFSSDPKPTFLTGCDNHIEDIKSNPEKCNTYHYSTESWVENNRFKRDLKNKDYDQLQHLDVIKEFYPI